MRNIIAFLLALIIVLMSCSAVFAAPPEQTLLDVAYSQISDIELQRLRNTDIYVSERLDKEKITDQKLMKAYMPSMCWEEAGDGLSAVLLAMEKLQTEGETRRAADYIVFGEKEVYCAEYDWEKNTVGSHKPEFPEKLIADLKALPAKTELKGIDCTVKGVHCLLHITTAVEAVLYLETDKGVFVKYYPPKGDSIIFTDEDFRKFSVDYWNYILSRAYNEKGEPINGANITFEQYLSDSAYTDVKAGLLGYEVLYYIVVMLTAGIIALCLHRSRYSY